MFNDEDDFFGEQLHCLFVVLEVDPEEEEEEEEGQSDEKGWGKQVSKHPVLTAPMTPRDAPCSSSPVFPSIVIVGDNRLMAPGEPCQISQGLQK